MPRRVSRPQCSRATPTASTPTPRWPPTARCVWVANSAGNSVTEIDASTGAKVNLFKNSKFGFKGPNQLSDDGTDLWVVNDGGNSVTELNATTGALVRVIKGSSYKLHGTAHITSNGIDVWISNLRGTTLAELSATSGNFIKDVKVSALGLTQVNALTSDANAPLGRRRHHERRGRSERRIGIAGEGLEGQGRTDSTVPCPSPQTAPTSGSANDRTDSLSELNAKTGAFVRFIKGKNFDLSVDDGDRLERSRRLGLQSRRRPKSDSGLGVRRVNAARSSWRCPVPGTDSMLRMPMTYAGGHIWVAKPG